MSTSVKQIQEFIQQQAGFAEKTLCDMIRFPSTAGNDIEIQKYTQKAFDEIGCPGELVPIPESLKQDPEYTFGEVDIPFGERSNLIVNVKGTGGGKSLIVNAHNDIVPATEWKDAFNPKVENGIIYGRGASDDKGEVLTILLALKALKHFGVKLKGDLIAEAVIDEEVGGNGALATIRQGYKADGVVVLESTELQVHPANRGAIWFRIGMDGVPMHMGRRHEGVNAIEKMMLVINSLLEYEKELIAASQGHPYFVNYDNPVQMNLGMIRGGEWPSMVAAHCEIEGGIGFLPNKPMPSVKEDVKKLLENHPDKWVREHYKLEWPRLHNDAFEIPIDHPLVTKFKSATDSVGLNSRVDGWVVSCDARLFKTVGDMPVLVFGPGTIKDAHSANEKIAIADILKAAEALAVFIMDWCETSE